MGIVFSSLENLNLGARIPWRSAEIVRFEIPWNFLTVNVKKINNNNNKNLFLDGLRLVNPIETLSRDTLILTNEISMLLQVSPTVKTSEFIFTPRWFSKSTIVRGGQFYFLIWRKLFFFACENIYTFTFTFRNYYLSFLSPASRLQLVLLV